MYELNPVIANFNTYQQCINYTLKQHNFFASVDFDMRFNTTFSTPKIFIRFKYATFVLYVCKGEPMS